MNRRFYKKNQIMYVRESNQVLQFLFICSWIDTIYKYYVHCWLEQVSDCQQSWPENNYMFFIPITIPEIAASTFFPVTVWTPGGTAIIFAQSWNFKLKICLDIHFTAVLRINHPEAILWSKMLILKRAFHKLRVLANLCPPKKFWQLMRSLKWGTI